MRVNGTSIGREPDPDETLLSYLRNALGLLGAKEACGRGECGACTVLIDGDPIASCVHLATLVEGDVTTIEGLAEQVRDLREAFAEFGGFQCGFCTSGQIVHGAAILRTLATTKVADPERFVRHQLSGNICRCTGYNGIVKAVLQTHLARAARTRSEAQS